jgi:MFS superfamily sulfate permease-like transporter
MQNNKQKISELYHIDKFDEKFDLKRNAQKCKSKYTTKFKQRSFYTNFLYRHLPIIDWLPKYKVKSFLIADVFAGLIVGIMNIPQGMGYALLANLEPVNGLYISFFPLLIYAFLGTSRQLAIGKNTIILFSFYNIKYFLKGSIAIVSLLSGQCIAEMSNKYAASLASTPSFNTSSNASLSSHTNNDELIRIYRVQIASSLTLLVGLIQALMGVLGLGFITRYFSDSFNSAYTSACAIHVLVSQIKELFGFKNMTKYEGILNIPKVFLFFDELNDDDDF